MAAAAVRAAQPKDAEALAAVKVRAWRAAYAGLLPDDRLASLDPAREAQDARGFVAVALWHFSGNGRAAAFYDRAGIGLDGTRRRSEFGIDEVRRMRTLR